MRTFKYEQINFEAQQFYELTIIENHNCPILRRWNDVQIESIKERAFECKFTSETSDVERYVKDISKFTQKIAALREVEGAVRVCCQSRAQFSQLESKKDCSYIG